MLVRRLTFVLVLAAGGVAAGAGCGSSGRPSSAPAHRAHRATPPASATTPAATAPATTTQTTSGESASACATGQLALSAGATNGAAGHIVVGFVLRNVSSTACHTYGFPGVQLVDGSGAALPTSPSHVTHDLAGPVPLRRVELAPGAHASFRIAYSDVASGAQTPADAQRQCPRAAGLHVIPPDQRTSLAVSVEIEACRGELTVSPVEPDDQASATG